MDGGVLARARETRSASTTNSWLANAAAWWPLASKPEADGAEKLPTLQM